MEFQNKDQVRALIEKAMKNAPPVLDARAIRPISVGEYVYALRAIAPDMTDNQRRMLLGHAQAPGWVLTMSELAALAGFPSHSAANLQYGLFAGTLLEVLGVPRPKYLVYGLAHFDSDPDTAHSRAHMYPQLHEALQQLGWIPRATLGPAEGAHSISTLTQTERQSLLNVRIGQTQFRSALVEHWNGRCALTGCDLLPTLVASHIRPWAMSNDEQKLDPFNGLLLSANADRLFDQGLMSFDSAGRVLLKPLVTDQHLAALGLSRELSITVLSEEHLPYLAAHRSIHGF